MGLVAIFESPEYLYGVVHRRLAHQHRLETPFERGVFLYVLAVLINGGCPDDAELSAGERGFEHVGRVHRTLGGAGSHDRVQLVDKDNLRFGVFRYLVYDLLETLLELAPELGTGDHAREVQRQHPPAGEGLRHLVVDHPLGDALDDGGLADAGVSDEHGVVLGTPGQHLYGGLYLVGPPDDRVQLALSRHLGEVPAVFVEGRRGARRFAHLAALVDATHHRPAQLGVRESKTAEELPSLGFFVPRQREQNMLRPDV